MAMFSSDMLDQNHEIIGEDNILLKAWILRKISPRRFHSFHSFIPREDTPDLCVRVVTLEFSILDSMRTKS